MKSSHRGLSFVAKKLILYRIQDTRFIYLLCRKTYYTNKIKRHKIWIEFTIEPRSQKLNNTNTCKNRFNSLCLVLFIQNRTLDTDRQRDTPQSHERRWNRRTDKSHIHTQHTQTDTLDRQLYIHKPHIHTTYIYI